MTVGRLRAPLGLRVSEKKVAGLASTMDWFYFWWYIARKTSNSFWNFFAVRLILFPQMINVTDTYIKHNMCTVKNTKLGMANWEFEIIIRQLYLLKHNSISNLDYFCHLKTVLGQLIWRFSWCQTKTELFSLWHQTNFIVWPWA